MPLRTMSRLLLGFVSGVFTGWLVGLLRTPVQGSAGSLATAPAQVSPTVFGRSVAIPVDVDAR